MSIARITLLLVCGAALVAGTCYTPHVEYLEGGLSIILTSAHGGKLKPNNIADRKNGCKDSKGDCYYGSSCHQPTSRCRAVTEQDDNTRELTMMLREKLHAEMGAYPSMVINNLHRSKLDPNRELDQAAQGDVMAEQAYRHFHAYIEAARKAIPARGLIFDIHGHGHNVDWAELGYYLTKSALNEEGGLTPQPELSSIRYTASLEAAEGASFEALLRGNTSFGRYLSMEGYSAVPSPSEPKPKDRKYFKGGYITKTYGSMRGGMIDAIQIESSRWMRRKSALDAYSTALARAIKRYWMAHYV